MEGKLKGAGDRRGEEGVEEDKGNWRRIGSGGERVKGGGGVGRGWVEGGGVGD